MEWPLWNLHIFRFLCHFSVSISRIPPVPRPRIAPAPQGARSHLGLPDRGLPCSWEMKWGTTQKSNELIPKIVIFKGSYLFQTMIWGIHVSFREGICKLFHQNFWSGGVSLDFVILVDWSRNLFLVPMLKSIFADFWTSNEQYLTSPGVQAKRKNAVLNVVSLLTAHKLIINHPQISAHMENVKHNNNTKKKKKNNNSNNKNQWQTQMLVFYHLRSMCNVSFHVPQPPVAFCCKSARCFTCCWEGERHICYWYQAYTHSYIATHTSTYCNIIYTIIIMITMISMMIIIITLIIIIIIISIIIIIIIIIIVIIISIIIVILNMTIIIIYADATSYQLVLCSLRGWCAGGSIKGRLTASLENKTSSINCIKKIMQNQCWAISCGSSSWVISGVVGLLMGQMLYLSIWRSWCRTGYHFGTTNGWDHFQFLNPSNFMK